MTKPNSTSWKSDPPQAVCVALSGHCMGVSGKAKVEDAKSLGPLLGAANRGDCLVHET